MNSGESEQLGIEHKGTQFGYNGEIIGMTKIEALLFYLALSVLAVFLLGFSMMTIFVALLKLVGMEFQIALTLGELLDVQITSKG